MRRRLLKRPRITRRRFLQATAAATGLGVATGLYAWQWEPHWLDLVERPLPVAHLPDSLVGRRLVQVSDMHIGPRVDDGYLIGAFDRVKALSPEIVVYTGDFITDEARIYEHVRAMSVHLPLGRQATLGVLGNHDFGPRWSQAEVADRIVELVSAAGVRILRNEIAEVGGLHIVGMDDLWGGRFDPVRALGRLDPQAAAVALSHNPDSADRQGWGDYQGWILAGHTHGGQCKLPFFPPPILSVRNRRYISGEYALAGNRRMYISRGVGHSLKVRFNVRPEITVFTLARA